MTLRAVDLFCGAGGASLGAEWAGADVVAAVDSDTTPLQTHHENLPGEPLHRDLSHGPSECGMAVEIAHELPDVDYLHASPPCKGFSTASGSGDKDDPRNALAVRAAEWIVSLEPAVATIENVPAIERHSDVLNDLRSTLRAAGYQLKSRVLNATNYGVPQTRKRWFLVAVDDGLDAPSRWFPRPTHAETPTGTIDGRELEPWVSVEDAIGDLCGGAPRHTTSGVTGEGCWRGPDEPAHTQKADGAYLTDQVNEAHQKAGRRPIRTTEEPATTLRAGTPPKLLPNHEPADHGDEARGRMESVGHGQAPHPAYAKPCPEDAAYTVVGGHSAAPIHYHHDPDGDGPRRLTVRECARLQSFPDWFVFVGGKQQQYEQVGNAVPPLLQYRLCEHLFDAVFGVVAAGDVEAATEVFPDAD